MPALAIVNLTKRYVQRIPGYHFITLDGLRSVDEVPAKYQDDIDDDKLAVRVLPNERRRIAARPAYGRWAAMLEEDVVLPGITITTPTSSLTYVVAAAGAFSLSGTASDVNGITSVTWTNSLGGSGTATGTTSWTIPSVTIAVGYNVITVTAHDGSGNTSTDVLTVTIDAVNPTCVIVSPASDPTLDPGGTTAALSGTAADNFAVTSVTWTNSLGGSGTATGTTSWTIPAVALGVGANLITVTAHDAAGNTGSDTVTIDTTP